MSFYCHGNKATILLDSIIMILVIFIGYVADLRGLQKELATTRKQVAIVSKQLSDKKHLISQERSKRLSPLSKADFAMSNYNIGMASVMGDLEKILFTAQVKLRLFEPSKIKEDKWFVIYPIKIELDGEYKNLLLFLEQVFKCTKCTNLIMVDSLVLQKKSSAGVKNLNMRLVLSFYQNKFMSAKKSTLDNRMGFIINAKEHDIFRRRNLAGQLHLWASHELCFLGVLNKQQKNWAIVCDPTGEVYQVKVGDRIGLRHSKITAIDNSGITTINPTDDLFCDKKC